MKFTSPGLTTKSYTSIDGLRLEYNHLTREIVPQFSIIGQTTTTSLPGATGFRAIKSISSPHPAGSAVDRGVIRFDNGLNPLRMKKPVMPRWQPLKLKAPKAPRLVQRELTPRRAGENQYRYNQRVDDWQRAKRAAEEIFQRKHARYLLQLRVNEERLLRYRLAYERRVKLFNQRLRHYNGLLFRNTLPRILGKGRKGAYTQRNPHSLLEFKGDFVLTSWKYDFSPNGYGDAANYVLNLTQYRVGYPVDQVGFSDVALFDAFDFDPEAERRLQARVYHKLGHQEFNLGVIFAERAETARLLSNIAKRLRDIGTCRIKRLAEALARGNLRPDSLWLAWNFGMAPVLSDADKVFERLRAEPVHCGEIRIKTHEDVTLDQKKILLNGQLLTVSGKLRRSVTYVFHVDNPFLFTMQQVGLVSPSTIWAASPWTWLVDWLLPISRHLQTLSEGLGTSWKEGQKSINFTGYVSPASADIATLSQVVPSVSQDPVSTPYSFTVKVPYFTSSGALKVRARQNISSAPVNAPPFKVRFPLLNAWRVATLSALFAQKFMRY